MNEYLFWIIFDFFLHSSRDNFVLIHLQRHIYLVTNCLHLNIQQGLRFILLSGLQWIQYLGGHLISVTDLNNVLRALFKHSGYLSISQGLISLIHIKKTHDISTIIIIHIKTNVQNWRSFWQQHSWYCGESCVWTEWSDSSICILNTPWYCLLGDCFREQAMCPLLKRIAS